jgi:hypothetical protein
MEVKNNPKIKNEECFIFRATESGVRMNQSQNQGLNIFENAGLGLAISDKKIITRKTEWKEHMVCSSGIPAVLRNRKLSEFLPNHFLEEENA